MDNNTALQLLRIMNPELAPILDLLMTDSGSDQSGNQQQKRKASAYNRRYAAAYRRIKRQKTLKSGKMAKGFSGKRGHLKIVKMAHAQAKRKGRK